MMLQWCAVVAVLFALVGHSRSQPEAASFLAELEGRSIQECNKLVEASWKYETDITEQHSNERLRAQLEKAKWDREKWNHVQEKWGDRWQDLKDPFLKRQFRFHSVLGIAALPKDKLERYSKVTTEMQEIYSKAKICDYRRAEVCTLRLEPNITKVLKESRDFDELQHVWTAWRQQSGGKMMPLYKEFVELANEAARLNKFDNMAEMVLYSYESDDFKEQVKGLWEQLKPLYQQLHAYMRRKLRDVYGSAKVGSTGGIPAHLLGNMWGQSWTHLYDIAKPFPNKQSPDVSEAMLRQGYTPERMFQLSDDFFKSLNLTAMPENFWRRSIFERAQGREMVCHPSAWDFCNGRDFGIKQCTDVNMEYLITTHHEMGHIQYFLQYKDQPLIFREGANPGFHEAVGDVMALSVATPGNLHRLGLLEADDLTKFDDETDINYLLLVALEKVAFLPFGLLMDVWRWDVFSGDSTPETWNDDWWKLRWEIQGLEPPTHRGAEDFDPGAKFHIAGQVPYIRYFVSFILQFQFHKALCLKAGQFEEGNAKLPLHHCNIYNSKDAGNAMSRMLALGASRPWPEALQQLTGSPHIDASVLREYFRPLEAWLREDNAEHGEHVGWEDEGAGPFMRQILDNGGGVPLANLAAVIATALCVQWWSYVLL